MSIFDFDGNVVSGNGSVVDASIYISMNDAMRKSTDFETNDIEYDESEIVNLANKLYKGQEVNVQISGLYSYYSGGLHNGRFVPISVETSTYWLYIIFMAYSGGDCSVYSLNFEMDHNSDYDNLLFTSVESFGLVNESIQMVTE